MTTYKILVAETSERLEELVASAINDGFQPFGGVSVAILDAGEWNNYTFAQAIIKR